MKQSVILAALGALTIATNSQAVVIDFTAAEGYTNGYLHTQAAYKWWSNTDPTAWLVDTSGSGHATLSSAAGDSKSIGYNLGTPPTNGYTGSVDFSFTVGTPASGTTPVVSYKVADSANSYKGPSFEIKAQVAGGYTMDIWNDVSSTYVSAGLSGAAMGLNPDGTGTTAQLRLSFTTTTNGPGTWTTVVTLKNADSNAQVGSITDAGWAGEGWASHFQMSGGQLTVLSGSVSVDKLTFGDISIGVPVDADVIDFTAAQGYVSGALHTQAGYKWWCGTPANIDAWQVDTNGFGFATISSAVGDWKAIAYDRGAANAFTNGYTGLVDLALTLGSNTVSGAQTLFDFMFQDAANGYKGPQVEFKAQPAGGFSWDIWNNVNSGFISAGLGGNDMGLTNGTGTAKLRLCFTTASTGTAAWTTVLTLTNLNSGAQVGTLTQNWTGQGWFEVLKMEQAAMNTVSGTSGLIAVDQIAFGPVGATLPPPHVAAPTSTVLSIQNLGDGTFTLQWANGGTLQQTTDLVTGSWQPVSGATSPYTNSLTGAQMFYRVHP